MKSFKSNVLKTASVCLLSLLMGAQAMALVGPATSGYDVGANCADQGVHFDSCIRGGCAALHGSQDSDGYKDCLKKARTVAHISEDEVEDTPEVPEPTPDPEE